MLKNFVSYEIDLDNPPALTQQQMDEIAALAARPDSEIDYSDIPPLTDDFFEKAVPFRTLLERHRSTRIQVEPEIFAWIETQSNDPQSHINDILRQQMIKSGEQAA